MVRKLGENGYYEGSRIILPEHRDAYLAHMREQERRGKPVLDEQELQLIEDVLVESYNERTTVTLTVFNPFDDEELRGVVTAIDKPSRKIKFVRSEDDYSYIEIEAITAATL
ncbi:YolD-like family protein [Bacillales bacterium AN1005]